MAIGEFTGPAQFPPQAGVGANSPLYWFYEMGNAALNPSRAMADASRLMLKNPINPVSHTTIGKSMAAACELFERTTRRYGKPEWGITHGEQRPARAGACQYGVEPPLLQSAAFRARL